MDERPMVAFLAPRSGDFEHIGARASSAVSMAATQFGVARIESFDTEEGAAEAYQNAVGAGAVAIIGPIGELESREVIAASDPNGPPIFLLSSVQGIEAEGDHVFRMRTSPADQTEAIIGHVLATTEMTDFAVLAPDDSYGDEAVLAALRAVSAFGGVLNRVVRYEAEEPDASDAVATLVGERTDRLSVPTSPWRTPPSVSVRSSGGDRSRPHALLIPDFGSQVASLLPYLEFHGWIGENGGADVALLGLSGWAGLAIEAAGDLAASAQITQVYSSDDFRGLAEGFALEYEIRFERAPTEFDAQVFDAATFVMELLHFGPETLGDRAFARDDFAGVCGEAWLSGEGALIRVLGLWEMDGLGQLYPIDSIRPPREGALR
ncbi:MAG: ABC-type branched-subunit amino acid transport system substrate-binding protein [Bradymonadia bacterium]|jgi:ABC-type branched-subunit amino acid transport system substrate-binding protein